MKKSNNPIYVDGKLSLFSIVQSNDTYPIDVLKNENIDIWFEELSVFDSLRFEFEARNLAITMKIRIPQYKKIGSLNVVKIDGVYHKVYSAAHFTSKSGFLQTDLTLIAYNEED